MLAYDNYQRGLTLQHQQGKHSSAYFKGTHQCAHKVIPFKDTRWDCLFVDFSQLDQDIPSPVGMPAFELVNLENPARFFLNFDLFESCTLPDFTGN